MRTDICSGDCIITFSRRGIFDYKRRVEEQTGMRCAVIYGGLPPETRYAAITVEGETGVFDP